MAELIGEGRPIRACLACGGRDDHPRCQVQIDDKAWAEWHPDCHYAVVGDAGCHPQCNGDARPGPGRAMLDAINNYGREQ